MNPEEGAVRFVMFGAMAGLLVASLCVPDAFGDRAFLFACAYGVVRFAQVALLYLAGRDDPVLRHSVVTGLLWSTTIGVALLMAAALISRVPISTGRSCEAPTLLELGALAGHAHPEPLPGRWDSRGSGDSPRSRSRFQV